MQIFVFKKKNLWILGGYCGKKKKPWGVSKKNHTFAHEILHVGNVSSNRLDKFVKAFYIN